MRPLTPPSPPSSILFLLRFLLPSVLLTSTFLSITLQTLPYFVIFLLLHTQPSYAISLSTFPAPTLLFLLVYSTLAAIIHALLALLIHFSVLNPSLSPESLHSLSIPIYANSIWSSLRLLLPHVLVLLTTLITLLIRIPGSHHYAGSNFILAWFRRQKRQRQRPIQPPPSSDPTLEPEPAQATPQRQPTLRQRAQSVLYRRPKQESPAQQSGNDFASLQTDDDTDITLTPRRRQPGAAPSLTRFSVFMAGRGGLFWCAVSTVLTAISYSSLGTFVFLVAFSGVVISWAFHIRWLHPTYNTVRCMAVLRVFRWYVMAYVLLLVVFQLPWFVQWYDEDKEGLTVGKVLRFIGLVPVNTAVDGGPAYVTALSAAIATYLFTGMLEGALRDVHEALEYAREHVSEDGEDGVENVRMMIKGKSHKLSYYEEQFIVSIMHASSLALLTWALVFPGLFTLPLLVAALVYLGLKKYRKSHLFDYLIPYALGLQMVHYLLIAAMDAFEIADTTNSDVVFMLGFRSLSPQSSVNLIQSVAIGLLCMNVSSRRYMANMEKSAEQVEGTDGARSIGIEDFVRRSLFSSKSRERDSLYSPMKLCIDQLALASLYVAGGLDLTALNAVFLISLSTICILQSFGLFRRPKIFAVCWAVVLVYAILFLLTTSTFCRALSVTWECDLDPVVGLKMADRGQVVAYAATVVLASLQVTFTWSYSSTPQVDYAKEFETKFWLFLRRYFLYFAYGALLFYPLSFPANFLSYGYVLFLFLSIVVELLLPSLQGREANVRKAVKKYWLIIIIFSCTAMLSRYFVRLDNKEPNLQRWIFGLETNDSRKFVVTIGDAVVLIVMSLQGRLFVVDSLLDALSSQGASGSGALSSQFGQDGALLDNRDTWSEPGELAAIEQFDQAEDDLDLRRHRRHKSVEEYIENELSVAAQAGLSRMPSRRPSRAASKHLLQARLSQENVGEVEHGSRSRQETDMMREGSLDEDAEERERQNVELELVLNRARVVQALELFRNFRKSVPVQRTEKFLYDTYALLALMLRNIMMRYSYVLSAAAILGASTWLLGISVFGALYLVLGCVLLLVEQPLFTGRKDLININSGQRIAKSMPASLIIFSFTLMSAQYIFLIAHVIVENVETVVTSYLGLEAPNDKNVLPITMNAMIAHVLVFLTAIVQKIAVRWARRDAELLIEEEHDVSEVHRQVVDPLQSSSALDSAVPIESVLEGVGDPGGETRNLSGPLDRSSFSQTYPRNWSETKTWKEEHLEPSNLGPHGMSSSSTGARSEELSDSGRGSEQERIVLFYSKMKEFLRRQYRYCASVLSLLVPFWKDWGFDITFMYLMFCGVITTSVFSVLYIVIVVAFSNMNRRKIQHHWHQVTLLLVLLVLGQYLLTLGLPRDWTEVDSDEDRNDWKVWLLLEHENSFSERKVSITFGFIAVICAGVTLNSVSEGNRDIWYWFHGLNSTESLDSLASNSSHDREVELRELMDMTSEDDDISAHIFRSPKPTQAILRASSARTTDSQSQRMSDAEKTNKQPRMTHFISGLGLPRTVTDPGKSEGLKPEKGQGRIDSWLASVGYTPATPEHPPADNSKPGTAQSAAFLETRPSIHSSEDDGLTQTSLDVVKQVFRINDPCDFTRRPMSFPNWVKLSWMRFVAPFVHLFVFAVATVDTNVISAILLLMSFSFLFQFTNVSAKRSRFTFVRWYVLLVVFLLVVYQAPIKSSSSNWEEILGLFKKESSRGRTFIYLMVSLWIVCQILGRVYESKDFYYVEKYGQEDAKVRFKRAVHEHNGRKYEKMVDRNKGERSNYARKSRLLRLQALKESEKTVDAFYNVCVVQEVELLKKQAAALEDSKGAFATHRLPEERKSEENMPTGLDLFVRKLLRGKRWRHYVTQSISSEAKAFVFRYSAWPVYAAMLLAAIANPSATTIAYPIAVFLYLIVEQPRPPKQAWTILMVYACAAIALKYVLRSPRILKDCDNIPFFALRGADPSVRNLEQCALAAGIGFDIFVLLALLGHRAVLYTRGVWDLAMSEEDMVLRSEIRGREIDTPPEMGYVAGSLQGAGSGDELDASGSIVLREQFNGTKRAWTAEEQCDDVEHILSQARKDIAGEKRENGASGNVKIGTTPNIQRKKSITQLGATSRPTLALPIPTRPLVAAAQNLTGGEIGLRRMHSRRPGDSSEHSDFWNTRGFAPISETSRKQVPRTAPPVAQLSEFRRSPSAYGSDISRGQQQLRRHRTFRVGWRAPEVEEIPEAMTAGQSRIQTSLIQGNIIPEKRRTPGGGGLALFNVQQKGLLSASRQYLSRLTRENDHKAVGDYYLLIFVVDFISFVYIMFGFSAVFGDSSPGRRETWWTTNFIETRHLITLLVMFTMIILDRVCYLTRSMLGKLTLQYTSVIGYHVVLFFVEDHIGTRTATRIFYILRCIYFLLSGLQIRDGFPMYTTAQFLLRNYTTLGIVLFEIYIFVPFLWLTRTLLDWAVLPTSLEIFQYFRFIDIYHWLYRNRAINKSRGGFRRTLGEKRRLFPRIYQGFGLFLLCVIALFAPFIIFSIFNPFFVGRDLREASVQVDLQTFDSASPPGGNSYRIFSRSSVVGEELSRKDREQVAADIGAMLTVRERESVFAAKFAAVSDSPWQLFPEDKEALVVSLNSFASSETSRKPKLSFSLSATTKEDRNTFGTSPHDYELNRSEAGWIANAIAGGDDFAMKLESPLPRYLILQSSESVFQPSGEGNGVSDVCIRLYQNGAVFWSMSLCTEKDNCFCSIDAPFESTSSPIDYLLQVADIAALQVGGATILTLYTVILFTIGNLLKRMFINMRFLIPYIDMPYTLHLYQLVLDIMYARQDNQLEMEEILYNGLIDIYRDQRELVRWTGERALKLPEEWWDRSKVDDPFMVYPSFAESATEPYISRVVE